MSLGAQLLGEDVGDEIFFGGEVGVEGAVREAGIGHQGRHPGAIDAVLLEPSSGCFDYSSSRGVLVVPAVAHGKPFRDARSCRGICWVAARAQVPGRWVGPLPGIRHLYYDRTIVL